MSYVTVFNSQVKLLRETVFAISALHSNGFTADDELEVIVYHV